MSKKNFVLLALPAFLFVIICLNLNTKNEKHIVAITQIAPHPSLDRIRAGIIDGLKASDDASIEVIFENAFANIATATQIAQRFASMNAKVIVPITTPSAQTVQAATVSQNIPIVFVAITDPKEAHIVNADGTNMPNVTGVTDAPPYEKQVKQIKDILCKDEITLGVLYNPGEPNSVSQIKQIEREIQKFGGKVILSPAASTVNISQSTNYLVGKVDAIYLPNDNTVVSALASVLKIAEVHKIPVFSSDPESVKAGCTAAIAPDQYAIGLQAAKIILRILKGEKAESIPVENSLKINEYVRVNGEVHTVLCSPKRL
jgi:putative ABC transport system substrate-binding protein